MEKFRTHYRVATRNMKRPRGDSGGGLWTSGRVVSSHWSRSTQILSSDWWTSYHAITTQLKLSQIPHTGDILYLLLCCYDRIQDRIFVVCHKGYQESHFPYLEASTLTSGLECKLYDKSDEERRETDIEEIVVQEIQARLITAGKDGGGGGVGGEGGGGEAGGGGGGVWSAAPPVKPFTNKLNFYSQSVS